MIKAKSINAGSNYLIIGKGSYFVIKVNVIGNAVIIFDSEHGEVREDWTLVVNDELSLGQVYLISDYELSLITLIV